MSPIQTVYWGRSGLLQAISLGFSTIGHHPEPPPAAPDCQPIVSRKGPIQSRHERPGCHLRRACSTGSPRAGSANGAQGGTPICRRNVELSGSSPLDYYGVVSIPLLVTVVETPEFITRIDKLMADDDRHALIDHLARHPTAGDLMPGTGGVRKLRWGLEGRGKRGGARIIYLYHSAEIPLFALTAFAKNERADLSAEDRNAFRRLTKLLVETYRKGRR